MNLADSVQGGEDSFKILLNYKGKYTFSQEQCIYDGRAHVVYIVPFAGMDYYLLVAPETRREDVFAAFDAFVSNMLRFVSEENNPYTAVLVLRNGKFEPIITIDVSTGYETQEVLFIFGLRGEIVVLGYNGTDLRKCLGDSFKTGIDLHDVQNGSENTIRTIFGRHDTAVITPADRENGELDNGDAGDVCCGADDGDSLRADIVADDNTSDDDSYEKS